MNKLTYSIPEQYIEISCVSSTSENFPTAFSFNDSQDMTIDISSMATCELDCQKITTETLTETTTLTTTDTPTTTLTTLEQSFNLVTGTTVLTMIFIHLDFLNLKKLAFTVVQFSLTN